ncbi:uncharacterized protein PFLUO_LOCUS6061 [Penicillium psychrofluorescens]|uniref:uncharacterized protein n=1 Tax=Penicillium psychrofluorescens TaxID=3158075 RepID=UPI003CCD0BD7
MDAATSQPLADRPTNTHLASTTTTDKKGDLSMDYHRQMLQGKLESDDKQPTAYVSPSDDIMSPCTKKLSDIKGKRFKNAGKPQSLFAKLGKKSYEQSASTSTATESGTVQ